MTKNANADLLFDWNDPRYATVAGYVVGDWENPIQQSDFSAFEQFVQKRHFEVVVAAARKESPSKVQEALLSNVDLFEHCFRLIWIMLDPRPNPTQDKKDLHRYYGDKAFRYHSMLIRVRKNLNNNILRKSLHLVVHRTCNVCCWLLPEADLQRHGVNASNVVAACKRIMDPVPDDKRKIAAAEDIHDFEQILLRILDGRKVESAREEKREEGKLSPTALFTRLPMPPTTLQIAIFETLNGKSMKKDELAAKTGWETSSVSDALKPMMKVGIIENRRGLGYFRHDAPPLPESQSSIDTKQ